VPLPRASQAFREFLCACVESSWRGYRAFPVRSDRCLHEQACSKRVCDVARPDAAGYDYACRKDSDGHLILSPETDV
jgi:hypothetical protein